MQVRPRSLISNSIGSVLASGMLIFSTVLIPAVLARALTLDQYQAYSIVLASLSLILILPQSMRTVGASQLALAVTTYGSGHAIRQYWRFCAVLAPIHLILATLGIELYVALGHAAASAILLRQGLYCIVGYTAGLIAVGFAIAPAAAQRDFRPDNIAKAWPGMFQLAGLALVWQAHVQQPLPWIFAVYVASSWSLAAILFLRSRILGRMVHSDQLPGGDIGGEFLRGLRGVLWWNLTAYLATTAAVMIVAIAFPSWIVPFSIATSLLGIVSAALVAVSGPVAVHASSALDQPAGVRRRFFLLINTMFQFYIAVTALVIVAAPASLYALWLTPELAGEVKTATLLLLPATVIRLLTMSFTIFVMSAGRQHTLWFSPMVEAIFSISGSVILGSLFGILGIPLALGVSALIRLILTVVHDERLNRAALALERGDVLLSGWRLSRQRHAHLS